MLRTMDLESDVRAVLGPPWTPGVEGRGLLVTGPDLSLRLVTWAAAGHRPPHHLEAMVRVGLTGGEVAAMVLLQADGGVDVMSTATSDRGTFLAEVLRLDARLHAMDWQGVDWDDRARDG